MKYYYPETEKDSQETAEIERVCRKRLDLRPAEEAVTRATDCLDNKEGIFYVFGLES
jgi:hypothetical protein